MAEIQSAAQCMARQPVVHSGNGPSPLVQHDLERTGSIDKQVVNRKVVTTDALLTGWGVCSVWVSEEYTLPTVFLADKRTLSARSGGQVRVLTPSLCSWTAPTVVSVLFILVHYLCCIMLYMGLQCYFGHKEWCILLSA